ncbi:MAG: hypothetical protein MO852_14900 [Candidatus Devosia euplotis]|nr:hypothetical protein [Candidatus Devosia euplotis]
MAEAVPACGAGVAQRIAGHHVVAMQQDAIQRHAGGHLGGSALGGDQFFNDGVDAGIGDAGIVLGALFISAAGAEKTLFIAKRVGLRPPGIDDVIIEAAQPIMYCGESTMRMLARTSRRARLVIRFWNTG